MSEVGLVKLKHFRIYYIDHDIQTSLNEKLTVFGNSLKIVVVFYTMQVEFYRFLYLPLDAYGC